MATYTNSADEIITGNGNDVIYALGGDDYIETNGGADTIYGGAGNDYILSGAGADVVDGGAGNDYIEAGAGADKVYGGAGNDDLYGGAGRDTLDGGTGADNIIGGRGDDVMTAGNDSAVDRFYFSYNDTSPTGRDVIYGFDAQNEDKIVLQNVWITEINAVDVDMGNPFTNDTLLVLSNGQEILLVDVPFGFNGADIEYGSWA